MSCESRHAEPIRFYRKWVFLETESAHNPQLITHNLKQQSQDTGY